MATSPYVKFAGITLGLGAVTAIGLLMSGRSVSLAEESGGGGGIPPFKGRTILRGKPLPGQQDDDEYKYTEITTVYQLEDAKMPRGRGDILAFQKRYGLRPTGEYNVETMDKVEKLGLLEEPRNTTEIQAFQKLHGITMRPKVTRIDPKTGQPMLVDEPLGRLKREVDPTTGEITVKTLAAEAPVSGLMDVATVEMLKSINRFGKPIDDNDPRQDFDVPVYRGLIGPKRGVPVSGEGRKLTPPMALAQPAPPSAKPRYVGKPIDVRSAELAKMKVELTPPESFGDLSKSARAVSITSAPMGPAPLLGSPIRAGKEFTDAESARVERALERVVRDMASYEGSPLRAEVSAVGMLPREDLKLLESVGYASTKVGMLTVEGREAARDMLAAIKKGGG